ncbi:SDR family NAD(P)-dependent oxidoreductase [Tepidiforma sp.]|uniref:SDR family NAD(P)-dependent oxidoreductase n=1 Tax=Tepidiforma sp. TaxID=2682230 RepID=UPI002ADE0485|nr:SDR family oxidoreductase [Tepidiforma sp.]
MAEWNRNPGFDLSGKKALVVGCANPAGRAIALALAEAGADVAVASATTDGEEMLEARRIAKDVAALGRQSFSQGWDVTLPTNIQVSMKQLGKEFGHPSILVYNADAVLAKPFEKVTDAEFARLQAVNQTGAFATARSFIREFQGDGPGRLIFVTSIFAERGVEGLAAYTTVKSGVIGLSTALSQELAARGFTSNCIATGWMDWTPGRGPDEIGANLLLRFIPMRRFGHADELGALAVLLASDAAGYISGQVFHVDGGVSQHL